MKCHTTNNNITKKIINIILDVLVCVFSVVLLISLYSGIQTKVMSKPYTDFFGYSIFEVQTGSMAPSIKAGDWIIVKLTKDIKLNDVVTYESNGDYITHRVVELYKDTYVARGDANKPKDGIINKTQTVGRVVKVLRGIGIFKRIVFNPAVLIALIVTVLLCSLSFKKKECNNKKENKKESHWYEKIIDKISSNKTKSNKKKKVKIENAFDDYHEEKKEIEVETINDDEENKKEETEIIEKPMSEKISGSNNELSNYNVDDILLTDEEIEQELDKTSFFREILVDKSEINNTLLEIANNQVDNDNVSSKKEIKDNNADESDNPPNEVEGIQLDLLNSKKGFHKSKSIIEKVMIIKYEEIEKMILTLSFSDKEVNEASIQNAFVDSYIKAKYYNNYTDVAIDYGNNKNVKLTKFLKDYSHKLIEEYTGNDKGYSSKVNKYLRIMTLISDIQESYKLVDDPKIRMEFYKEKIGNYIDSLEEKSVEAEILSVNIMKIQKEYEATINYLLKKFETSVFTLEFNKINGKKNMDALKLCHNIPFSRVYSDYIVDKTYNEGVIAEDKLNVLLNLLSVQLVKDMTDGNFNKQYILYIPQSLYVKKRKLESLLRMIDDDYAREHIIILLPLDDFLTNEAYIKKLGKLGYMFALVLNNESTNYYKKLYLAEYVFVSKDDINIIERDRLPESDISEKIIYDDIIDKVGDFEVNE